MGTEHDLRDISGIVTAAWARALSLAGPDTGRAFLAQGGDSLRAMLLRASLGQSPGVDIALCDLLSCQGLDALILLVQTAGRNSSAPTSLPDWRAQPSSGHYMLSFAQERLAFMHQLASATAAYHIAQASRLRGVLQPATLRAAFNALVDRHESLTLSAITSGGQLRGRPGVGRRPTWRELDWSGTEDELQDWLSEFSNAPFDLSRGPMLRAALIRRATDDAILIVAAHHVALDQWAMDKLLEQLADGYNQFQQVGAIHASAPARFADFARWHREWFTRERRELELAYWQRHLQGLEPLSLNEDYVRPLQQSFRGARLRAELTAREVVSLRAYGATYGASLAMVLLTALKLLLARHSGRTDVAVGIPVSGRHHAETEQLIGAMLNTLVIRTEVDQAQAFCDSLQSVRRSMLEAFEHQDLPFDQLIQSLRLPRDPSRSPLFGVMFNMLNTPFEGISIPGVTWSRLDFDKRSSQFDLQVTVDADHSRAIFFEYATDLFAESTIRRLADQYLALLRRILQGDGSAVPIASSLPEAELREIREKSHGPRIPRTEGTLPACFLPVFAQHGDAIAIRSGEETVTYAQLADSTRRLAVRLRALGIGRGMRVGLCCGRSPRMVAAMLAVLEVGAAYVPLDPMYPTERLTFMASDADLALMLHDHHLPAEASWPAFRAGLLDLEAMSGPVVPEAEASAVALPSLVPTDPAYVIYTSGSTGRPKGVVVPHRAVTNLLMSMAGEPGLSKEDRLLAVTTLSFDIAVLELLLPLFVGAQVVIATDVEQSDAEALQRLIEEHRITVLQGTPSTWRMLVEAGWAGTPGIRALVGGEALPGELARSLLDRGAEVWNMYGPTETTVWSTCQRVATIDRTRIPIGRPIANTQVLVLGPDGEICPIGVPGEIHIGGDGLALGYLDRPELTDRSFITNRFSNDRRSGRLYRTGDRGRFREDGLIEHLGRLDAQIKVRGHRIEPGEIESRLVAHPYISDAAVIAREAAAGDMRLAAYVVSTDPELDSITVRAYLRQWLPEYMLPQHVVFLERMPLMPSGKLDRQGLPAVRGNRRDGVDCRLPGNTAERALWELWRELLGTDQFGIDDSFFEIGGHSLLAVQLVSLVRDTLHRACTLPMIFRHTTIVSLSAALEEVSPLVDAAFFELNEAEDAPALYCLCGIHLYQALADRLAPQFQVIGVYVPEEMHLLGHCTAEERPHVTVEKLAAEYVQAIRRHQPRGPYHFCGFSFGGVVAFEAANQLRSLGETIGELWILDSDVPGVAETKVLAALKSIARRAVRATTASLRASEAIGSAEIAVRTQNYLRMMREYRPQPTDHPMVVVQSRERPTYDGGRNWQDLAPNGRFLRMDSDHLGVLDADSVRGWLPEARMTGITLS